MDELYLDHAAATPLDATVLVAMQPYFAEKFYNPSALYSRAQQVRVDIDAARRVVAGLFGSRPAEVVFTAGGTEANNLAISGVMNGLATDYPDATLLMSAIEHDSVLAAGSQYAHQLIPVTEQGVVEPETIHGMIDDQTVLVSVMYANNEVGSVQPIKEIGRILAEVRADRRQRGIVRPLYFHSDAAQAANYLDLQTARLGVDLMTINGGKIYGPKQSGALHVRAGVVLQPLLRGGGQELGLRSGTENVPAVIGLAAALRLAQELRPAETKRLAELQAYFFEQLEARAGQFGEVKPVINGPRRRRLPNNLHITLPGSDNERLLYQLDAAGILAAAGSACSASSETPSHVLRAMGLSDAAANSSLRFSMGRATTRSDIDRLLATLAKLLTT